MKEYEQNGKMTVPGLYGIPFDIRITDIDKPKPDDESLILEVVNCGLCNSEVKTAKRGHPILETNPLPLIFGHEFSGRAVHVGKNVQGFSEGDRLVVMALIPCGYCYQCRRGKLNLCENYFRSLIDVGGFAPYVKITGKEIYQRSYKMDDGVSFEHSALAEPIACSLRGIEQADIRPGDTVTILGAGFMGLILTNLAALSGAAQVIVIDQYPHRLDVALDVGATEVINFTTTDSRKAVADLTAGRGSDVVIEATGVPEAYEDAFAMAGRGGTVVYFGGTAKGSVINLDPVKIHYQELRIVGSVNPSPHNVDRALLYVKNKLLHLDKLITHKMDVLELKEAMELALTKEPIKIMTYHSGNLDK